MLLLVDTLPVGIAWNEWKTVSWEQKYSELKQKYVYEMFENKTCAIKNLMCVCVCVCARACQKKEEENLLVGT